MSFEQEMADFLNRTALSQTHYFARDIYPQEAAQSRFENCLINMLRSAPDPKNVRTKAGAKVRRAKRKRYNNKAVLKSLKTRGKSSDIGYVIPETIAPPEIFALVDAQVPKGVTAQIRKDLVHDVIVDILSGDLVPADVHKQIKKYIRAAYKFLPHSLEDYMGIRKNIDIGSDNWKEQYVPVDERKLDEKISDLQDHWGTGESPKVPTGPRSVMPKARLSFGADKGQEGYVKAVLLKKPKQRKAATPVRIGSHTIRYMPEDGK